MARRHPEPAVLPGRVLPAHNDVHDPEPGPELGLRNNRAGQKSIRLERGKCAYFGPTFY